MAIATCVPSASLVHGTAVQVEQRQERRDRCHLIRFDVDGSLCKHQAAVVRPGTDQVDGVVARTMVMRPTQGFAINADDLPNSAG